MASENEREGGRRERKQERMSDEESVRVREGCREREKVQVGEVEVK